MVVRNEPGMPRGFLYPLDSTAFTAPVAQVHFVRHQRLPRTPPGDVVDVFHTGRKVTVVAADGTALEAAVFKRIRPSDVAPAFGEMGDVVVHPAFGRPSDWRYTKSISYQGLLSWRRRIRMQIAGGVAGVLFIVAFLMTGSNTPAYNLGGWAGFLILSGLLANGSRRSLRAARLAAGPSKKMIMRLWWSVGYGQGPVAVASLSLSDSPDAEEIANVPLVGVPEELEFDTPIEVNVIGDPLRAPLISVGPHILWPAQRGRPPAAPPRPAHLPK
jgi:hypothetical protein